MSHKTVLHEFSKRTTYLQRAGLALIELTNLKYEWTPGTPVLDVPSFSCGAGDRLFLQGESGSGKSTLLNVVCGVFEATAGHVNVLGHDFHSLKSSKRDQARAESIGVIFQQFNLVPFLSLIENVLLPARFSKVRQQKIAPTEQERTEKAYHLLDRLGLSAEAKSERKVTELSVGQQQRVAAARALIGGPSLIIADEPTSALDHATKDRFIETLLAEAREATVLFVSHDPTLAGAFERQVSMVDINKAMPPISGGQS